MENNSPQTTPILEVMIGGGKFILDLRKITAIQQYPDQPRRDPSGAAITPGTNTEIAFDSGEQQTFYDAETGNRIIDAWKSWNGPMEVMFQPSPELVKHFSDRYPGPEKPFGYITGDDLASMRPEEKERLYQAVTASIRAHFAAQGKTATFVTSPINQDDN